MRYRTELTIFEKVWVQAYCASIAAGISLDHYKSADRTLENFKEKFGYKVEHDENKNIDKK